jgi:hypothetical protein
LATICRRRRPAAFSPQPIRFGCAPALPGGLNAQTARPAQYRGWDTLHRASGLVELQVVPDIGGRVIQFRLGADDFLFVNDELAGRRPPVFP